MKDLTQTKILFVDDSQTIVQIIKRTLESIGMNDFMVALDGGEAWRLINLEAKTQAFDLILCDWIMPEISGIELLKLVRKSENPAIANVRFIMVTGAEEKVKEAMMEWADNFISKPFTPEQLKQKLRFVLR